MAGSLLRLLSSAGRVGRRCSRLEPCSRSMDRRVRYPRESAGGEAGVSLATGIAHLKMAGCRCVWYYTGGNATVTCLPPRPNSGCGAGTGACTGPRRQLAFSTQHLPSELRNLGHGRCRAQAASLRVTRLPTLPSSPTAIPEARGPHWSLCQARAPTLRMFALYCTQSAATSIAAAAVTAAAVAAAAATARGTGCVARRRAWSRLGI